MPEMPGYEAQTQERIAPIDQGGTESRARALNHLSDNVVRRTGALRSERNHCLHKLLQSDRQEITAR